MSVFFMSSMNPAEEIPALQFTWRALTSPDSATLPWPSGGPTIDIHVDWGDGNEEDTTNPGLSHIYSIAGDYQVTVTGTTDATELSWSDRNPLPIISLDQFGNLGVPHTSFFADSFSIAEPSIGVRIYDKPVAPGGSFNEKFMSGAGIYGPDIGSDFFSLSPGVLSFAGVFGDDEFLNNSGNLPANLFAGQSASTNFAFAFSDHEPLITIPTGLFSGCSGALSVEECFDACTFLVTIPSDLFVDMTALTNFQRCFGSCVSLLTIPSTLFDTIVSATPDFRNTFSGCWRITGALPELWNDFPSATLTSGCFAGCTNASNFGDVPAGWK